MRTYQKNYSQKRHRVLNRAAREKRAQRILKTLANYYGSISKLKNLHVLDIGCSVGYIDNYLAKFFKSFTGIDIDGKAILFAKKKFGKRKNLFFQEGDAMKLKFRNESFDVIIAMHIYEHVPDSTILFKEVYRVLKKKGVCYLAAQNKLWPIEPHYNLPFLSLLPQTIADEYVKLTKKADKYYEKPKTYWGLKKLTARFKVDDFTARVLNKPQRYGYTHPALPNIIAELSKFFTPIFFWILVKED